MDDPVHRRLHPAVPQRGAREDGEDPAGQRPLAQGGPQQRRRDRLPREVLLRRRVVDVGRRLEQRLAVPRARQPIRFGEGRPRDPRPLVFRGERDLLHRHEVGHRHERPVLAERNGQRNAAGVELARHVVDHPVEVGAGPVELVDERQPRDPVPVGLAPDDLRLRLHAPHAAKNRHRAVQHAERPLHLDGEIDVSGRVDQVDLGAQPREVRRRRGDRDPTLPLLRQVIHLRVAVVDLPHPVGDPGVVEEPLGEGRLPRVDVRDDPDVPEIHGGRHVRSSAGGC